MMRYFFNLIPKVKMVYIVFNVLYIVVLETNIRCKHLETVLDTDIKYYKFYWSTSGNGT